MAGINLSTIGNIPFSIHQLLQQITPSSGYNVAKNASSLSFKSETFNVTQDSTAVHPGYSKGTLNGTQISVNNALGENAKAYQNLVAQSSKTYQYDMFDRIDYGKRPSSSTKDPALENIFSSQDQLIPRSNIDNRVIINYKNFVQAGIYTPKNGADVFVNKIVSNNRFKQVSFKDPSIETIVQFLSKSGTPTTKISFADFLYCKKLGAYPNNRLVILRRFYQPVDDDLIDSTFGNTNQVPLSVMVTWFDEFPVKITFGEEWATFKTGLVSEISNTVDSLTGLKKVTDKFNISNLFGGGEGDSVGTQNVSAPWLKTLWYQFIDDLYRDGSTQIPPHFRNVLTEVNPNLIRESMIRRGLSFQMEFTLKFTYVMRYINGIDPHLAMHNIIANAIRMGTSTSTTIFPKTAGFLPKLVTSLNEGRIVSALTEIYNNISTYLTNKEKKATIQGFAQIITNVVGSFVQTENNSPQPSNTPTATLKENQDNNSNGETEKGKTDYTNFGKNFSRQLFSLYRFKLAAALQADMGLPSGVWHVTIGNPFNPIISCGDLILSSGGAVTMKMNNELSYDDQPTEVEFSISLKPARNRGAQEIEQLFNAGRGRIYVYPRIEDDPDLFLDDANPTTANKNNAANNNL